MNPATFNAVLEELTPKQKKVLRSILAGMTCGEIAHKWGYHPSTISKHLSAICKKFGLANQAGEYFSYRWDLIDLFQQWQPDWVDSRFAKGRAIEMEEPEGAVPLESQFYVERPPVESHCDEAVLKPGALIRIKAARQLGKTSLITRVLAHTAEQGAQTVSWDLVELERSQFEHLESFLRGLCRAVTRQLGLENRLSDYWESGLVSHNQNCTAYFEEYLLPQMEGSLVLGIDDVDRVFPYEKTAPDFLTLLRSWHERGKWQKLWAKLRLVIAHSTEEYAQLDVNQSPFNVGVPVTLPEFTQEQMQELAQRHGLNWGNGARATGNGQAVTALRSLVGGHPYLVRLALYQIAQGNITLEQVVQAAATDAGIYGAHLRRYWDVLHRDADLGAAMKQVVTASEPVSLNPGLKFKLHSMGLIEYQGNQVSPRCQLYRDYFCQVL